MPEIKVIPLNKIGIKPRQRKDYGDIGKLVESIKKYGQMQNLNVEPAADDGLYYLIAGGRRLAGIAASGLQEAIVKVWDGPIDEETLQELELEENVQRKDLTWQEKEEALATIHKIKMRQAEKAGEEWNIDSTAQLVGVSRRKIYNALELTKAVQENPDIAKADTAFSALKRLEHQKNLKKRHEEVKVRELAEEITGVKRLPVRVVQGDALALMKEIPDESQDYVITNPPYGVNIEEVFTAGKKIYADDTQEIMAPLCAAVFKEAFRVLKPDRWFVTFYPTLRLEECRQFLSDAGFSFQQVPAIWVKPNKMVSSITDPFSQMGIRYETFFFARKGEAKFHTRPKTGNVFIQDTPGSNRIHPLQMPPELWDEILQLITVGGEVGVEPFAGSGSGGIAALGRQLQYTGIELDPEYAERANTWIGETRLGVSDGTGNKVAIDNDEVPFE